MIPRIPMDTMKGIAGFAAVSQQQSLPQMGPQDRLPVVTQVYYANYVMDPLQVYFPFSVLSFPPNILTLLLQYFCFVFWFLYGHSLWQLELRHLGLHCYSPSEHTHGRDMCLLLLVLGLCQECNT